MPQDIDYLQQASEGLGELRGFAGELAKAIDQGGKKQAQIRDGVIQTINEMADALQLACDLVAKEISASLAEFNRIQQSDEPVLRSYFERLALRCSEPALRLLLHEGQVCGELHKLADRFKTPFSSQATAGESLWEAVKSFLTRSSRMSSAFSGLDQGERTYLRDIARFLDEIRDGAEGASALDRGSPEVLRGYGRGLAKLLREKRQLLQARVMEVRTQADAVIAALH